VHCCRRQVNDVVGTDRFNLPFQSVPAIQIDHVFGDFMGDIRQAPEVRG
jgi:hypothetical protein